MRSFENWGVGSSPLHGLDGLSNDELLTNTQRLVGCGNQLLAALLAHLGEVDARGLHRERSCASLYTYCVYVLRMPEDSALRRAKAARIVREFPATLTAIARGEIHLTGLLLLGPHLTEANLVEVLALAKHRSKKEIEKLVRRLDPLPDVPPRIEPLGPPRAGFVTNFAPTWNAMAQALAGPVRDLSPGERPSDWTVDPSEWVSGANGGTRGTTSTKSSMGDEADEPPMPHVAERYKVQFTANQEYVDLLEEARDLISHAAPNAGLDEVHRRALQCLVRELRKKKYGETDRPRDARVHETSGEEVRSTDSTGPSESNETDRTTRHIPARVRRRVAERDGRRCTYVDPSGQRCRETRLLEFHHLDAHARGGLPTEENLTLRCRAHNALAAEEDFGSRAHSPETRRFRPAPARRTRAAARRGTTSRSSRAHSRETRSFRPAPARRMVRVALNGGRRRSRTRVRRRGWKRALSTQLLPSILSRLPLSTSFWRSSAPPMRVPFTKTIGNVGQPHHILSAFRRRQLPR